MSLNGALQIGRTALLSSQAAIEVAGNNLANAATRGYHRQTVNLAPLNGQEISRGLFIGRGVQVTEIVRHISDALEGRLRNGMSDEARALARQGVLTQIEALQNEFSGNDVSSYLSAFFNSLSDLANRPGDNSLRSLVTQQAGTLSTFVRNLRSELTSLRGHLDADISEAVNSANDVMSQIEQINLEIAHTERGQGGASALRDERDRLLGDLAQFVDISTIEQPNGTVDVFIGSLPIILNGQSRGLELRQQTVNGDTQVDLILADGGGVVQADSGKIGALINVRDNEVNDSIDTLDEFAGQLIFQVNRIHSQGQGLVGANSITGDYRLLDTGVALNDPDTGLAFMPQHGSFQIHVTQVSTGQRVTNTINVDLDGLGSDTTLTDLAAAIDGVADIGASITTDGRLQIAADSGDFQISFSDDSSGALAALGINTFFSGSTAFDMSVNSVVSQNPALLAAGQGHVEGDNRNALAMADLRDASLPETNGLSVTEMWNRHVEDVAARLGQARSEVDSTGVVRQSLEAQVQSTSGVNVDEEAINLMAYQRAFQASARFLNVVDEMMQTLLQLV